MRAEKSFNPESPRKGSRTFTSPPYVPRAKRHFRTDFTHSDNRLIEIGLENSILVKKLTDINRREGRKIADANRQCLAQTHTMPCAHACVNRRRTEDRIAQENLLLYRRLQAIRPSTDIRRDELAKHHQINKKYRENCSKIPKQKGGR